MLQTGQAACIAMGSTPTTEAVSRQGRGGGGGGRGGRVEVVGQPAS